MRTIGAAIIFCLMTTGAVTAQDSFGPWAADVAVGDAAVGGVPAAGPLDRGASTGPEGIDRGVYDAFTGGALLLIRVFQIWISPLDGPSCRYHPVCSVYGKIAVQKYGALLGGVLAGDRILRCNILSKSGHDPVPDLRTGK